MVGPTGRLTGATQAWAFISAAFFLPRILAGTDQPRDSRIPARRAFLHHRLTTAPGEGPLADLAAATAAALSRAYGGHPLILAPASADAAPSTP